MVHRGVVFFSNFDDQRLYRQDPAAEPVADHARDRRAASLRRRPRHARRSRDDRASASATRTDGCRERARGRARGRLGRAARSSRAEGTSTPTPRISPDGTKLAWLAWDLPWMPWDGCELWVGGPRRATERSGDAPRRRRGRRGVDLPARVEPGRRPALRQRPLRLVEPVTGDDGERARRLHPTEAEFGWPQWVFGVSIVRVPRRRADRVHWTRTGRSTRGAGPRTGELLDLDLPVPRSTSRDRRGGVDDRLHRRQRRRSRRRSCCWTSRSRRSRCCRRARDHGGRRRSSRRRGRSSSPPRAA